jgi:putative copper export protein
MNTTILWLMRYGHVLGGAIWVGGYALLALVIVPIMQRNSGAALERLAINVVRILTYAGMVTIFFGLLLITRTRGFVNLFTGEWGFIIVTCIVIVVALLGIGDGGLRPALRHLTTSGDARAAKQWAITGFVLTVLAIGLMTRALYARS